MASTSCPQTLRQAEGVDPSQLSDWTQYGPIGLLVIAFLMGWVVPGPTHKREQERGDRLEQENRDLHAKIEDKVVPLVHDSIAAVRQAREGG